MVKQPRRPASCLVSTFEDIFRIAHNIFEKFLIPSYPVNILSAG